MSEEAEHPGAEALQALLDGELDQPRRETIERHLAGCVPCSRELRDWSALFHALEELPELAPSPRMRENVLARLPGKRAPTPLRWLGWAAAMGLLLTPSLGFLLVAAAIVAHPLLTLEGVATLLGWQLADFARENLTWIARWAMEWGLVALESGIAEAALSYPGRAFAALVALWAAFVGSGWTLYRNLLSPSRTANRHVQV